MHGQVLTNQILKTMKKNKKQRHHFSGKHCINIYLDCIAEDAGCFIQGSYEAFKPMLIAAANEHPEFGRAFLDAALVYANELVANEK